MPAEETLVEQSAAPPPAGTVLAFDYGEKRVGVAIGELSLQTAHPLITVRALSDRERLERIGALVKEWAPVLLIVGLPRHADGGKHSVAERCRAFARRLATRFKIETRLVDEHLTSSEANRSLAEAGVPAAKRGAMIDQVAAQHILATFFSLHGKGIA